MGRPKKRAPSEPVEKTRPVRLDLPPKAHRLLRLIAADKDMSMAILARDQLIAYLEDEARKRGIKS